MRIGTVVYMLCIREHSLWMGASYRITLYLPTRTCLQNARWDTGTNASVVGADAALCCLFHISVFAGRDL